MGTAAAVELEVPTSIAAVRTLDETFSKTTASLAKKPKRKNNFHVFDQKWSELPPRIVKLRKRLGKLNERLNCVTLLS